MKRKDWESVWVDFLEEESEPALQKDLELLLTKSVEHQAMYKQLSTTRSTIKNSIQNEPEWSDESLNALSEGVMRAIKDTTPVPLFWARVAKNRTLASTSLVALLILVLGVMLSQKDLNLEKAELTAQNSDWIIQLSAEHPEMFSNTLLDDRTGDEIILEAAASQFDQLSDLEIEQLFSSF